METEEQAIRRNPRHFKTVICPECGEVKVDCDVFEKSIGISGICPKCEMRLYFADPSS